MFMDGVGAVDIYTYTTYYCHCAEYLIEWMN